MSADMTTYGEFFQFCDVLEVKDGVSAPASGWGVDHALAALTAYYKDKWLPSSKWILLSALPHAVLI